MRGGVTVQATWVKVLQTLRAQKRYALFALVSSLDDLTFTDTQIIVQTGNDTEYTVLTKNLPLLQELCGNCLVVNAPRKQEARANLAYIEKLKDLFGDKVEIL